MKKTVSFLFAIVVLFLLAGCQKEPSTPPTVMTGKYMNNGRVTEFVDDVSGTHYLVKKDLGHCAAKAHSCYGTTGSASLMKIEGWPNVTKKQNKDVATLTIKSVLSIDGEQLYQ